MEAAALGIDPLNVSYGTDTEGDIYNNITDASDEIAGISPLLASIKNKNPYQVSPGFFESWKTNLPLTENSNLTPTEIPLSASKSVSSHKTNSSGRLVSMFSNKIIRYAVAACLIAILGTTVYHYATITPAVDPIKGLTAISDQDMANYLDAADIHWTPGINSETAVVDFSDIDIHELLSNISDTELEQYFPALPEQKGTVN